MKKKQTKVVNNNKKGEKINYVNLFDDEKDSNDFQNSVKKIFNKMNRSTVKNVRTNVNHFCAYVMWRLESNCGDNYKPRKGEDTKCLRIGSKYKKWFTAVISVPEHVFEKILGKGNAFYWQTFLKEHCDKEIVQEIQEILPMLSDSIEKRKQKVKMVKENQRSDESTTSIENKNKGN